jgi:hypothetical protein
MQIHDFVTAITTYCDKNSFGTVGTDLFKHTMPTTPIACTCVRVTGGTYTPGNPVKTKTFQVIHRRPYTGVGSGTVFVSSLHQLFVDQWNKLDTSHLGRLYPMSEPTSPVQDDNGNWVWSLNYVFRMVE